MRFDPERVVALAGAWTDHRRGPSGGERRAADEVAGHFERLGWRVERAEAPPRGPSPWGPALVLAVGLGATLQLGLDDLSTPIRVGLMGLIPATLLAAAGWAGRRGREAGRARGSEHIIGRPALPAAEPPTTRVVVLARLGATRAGARARGMVSLWGVFGLQGLILLARRSGRAAFVTPGLGLAVLLGQWLTALGVVLVPTWRAARPSPGGNRTGLALLAELARTWPRRIAGRAETRFIITPDARALAAGLAGPPGRRSATLVIDLDAPGVGAGLSIAARGPALRLADAAARDLWIPYVRARWGAGAHLRDFDRYGMCAIGLGGTRADGPIDPARLAAAAQLATELALRWAKRAVGPIQPDSADQSSQNRG